MLKSQVLVDVLKGKYTGSYDDFEKMLCDDVKKEMINLNDNEKCIFECVVLEELINKNGELLGGRAIGTFKIQYSKSIIMDLFKGNRINLITLFHELAHIRQNVLIESGVGYFNVISYIKDSLLNYYQELENDRFLGKSYRNSYYKNNYSNYSKEIDADIEAVYNMIMFCSENGIDISDIIETLENYVDDLKTRKDMARYVGGCITFNSYYLSLEKAFDIAVREHAEWLLWYPQLLDEYSVIDGGIVVRKDEDNKKDIVDLYHKPIKLVKGKVYL